MSDTVSAATLIASLEIGSPAPVTADKARALIDAHYGLDGEVSLLTGERDQNFRVRPAAADGWIFKVFGPGQPFGEAGLLAAILDHVSRVSPDLPVPRLRTAQDGRRWIGFTDDAGRDRQAIAYSFLPGTPLMDAPRSTGQQHEAGTLLARTAAALRTFEHPLMHRPLVWDLRHLAKLRALLPQIGELHFADFILPFLDDFAALSPALAALPHQSVHNDFNARNLIVDPADPTRITGIIDFGDAVHTLRIADVAVGVIGQLSARETAEDAMRVFVDAYQAQAPLDPQEQALLPWMIAGRIVQNVIMTSWHRARFPDDGHFASFGPDFFAWRIDFARSLRLRL